MGQEQATEKYKSSGITASVEADYSFKLGENEAQQLLAAAEAQVVWMDVQADSHREAERHRVKDNTDGNLMTRLRVKAFINGHSAIDDGKSREVPAVCWSQLDPQHANDSAWRWMIWATTCVAPRTLGELKVGVEGQIAPRLSVVEQRGPTGRR